MPTGLAGCTKLIDEPLHALKRQQALFVRLSKILADQGPVDVGFIALDDWVRARIQLCQCRDGHAKILVEIRAAG